MSRSICTACGEAQEWCGCAVRDPTPVEEVVHIELPDHMVRYAMGRDAQGFATGTLVPSDYGQWISSASVHRLHRELCAELNEAMRKLNVMTQEARHLNQAHKDVVENANQWRSKCDDVLNKLAEALDQVKFWKNNYEDAEAAKVAAIAHRDAVVLPEKAERWNLHCDNMGHFMKVMPNGEYVRWHRFESVSQQLAEAISQRDAARDTNRKLNREVGKWQKRGFKKWELKIVDLFVRHRQRESARADNAEAALANETQRCEDFIWANGVMGRQLLEAHEALATERARALQEAFKALPEISKDDSYNTAVMRAEQAILALIQK